MCPCVDTLIRTTIIDWSLVALRQSTTRPVESARAKRTLDAVQRTAVHYHIPPIAMVGIPPTLAARLHAEFPDQIVGIKDSPGNWDNTRVLLDIGGERRRTT